MKYETVAINSITLTTGLIFAVDTDCKVRVEVYITNMRMFLNMYDSNIYIQRVASVFLQILLQRTILFESYSVCFNGG